MSLFDYLTEKQKAQAEVERRNRLYFDIGCCLWYEIAQEQVLNYKGDRVEMRQNEPFLNWQMGDRFLVYGNIKELVSKADKEKFEKLATAELRDRLGCKVAVKVFPTSIVVRFE